MNPLICQNVFNQVEHLSGKPNRNAVLCRSICEGLMLAVLQAIRDGECKEPAECARIACAAYALPWGDTE